MEIALPFHFLFGCREENNLMAFEDRCCAVLCCFEISAFPSATMSRPINGMTSSSKEDFRGMHQGMSWLVQVSDSQNPAGVAEEYVCNIFDILWSRRGMVILHLLGVWVPAV